MEDKLLLLGVGRTFVWRMYEFIQVSIKKKVTDCVLDIRFSFFFSSGGQKCKLKEPIGCFYLRTLLGCFISVLCDPSPVHTNAWCLLCPQVSFVGLRCP